MGKAGIHLSYGKLIMQFDLSNWTKIRGNEPNDQDVSKSRRRYMVYAPNHIGYVYRCWYKDGFGSTTCETMISDATHYRIAKLTEKDHQLAVIE